MVGGGIDGGGPAGGGIDGGGIDGGGIDGGGMLGGGSNAADGIDGGGIDGVAPGGGGASSVAQSLAKVGAYGTAAGGAVTGGVSSRSSRLTGGAAAAAGALAEADVGASASLRPSKEKDGVVSTGSSIHERTLTGAGLPPLLPPAAVAFDATEAALTSPCFDCSMLAFPMSLELKVRTSFCAAAAPPPAEASGTLLLGTLAPPAPPRFAAAKEARISALEKALTSPLKSSACRSVDPRVPCGSSESAMVISNRTTHHL